MPLRNARFSYTSVNVNETATMMDAATRAANTRAFARAVRASSDRPRVFVGRRHKAEVNNASVPYDGPSVRVSIRRGTALIPD